VRDFDPAYVRFTPESGQIADASLGPLCAKSGHSHRSKRFCYSITSSAPNRNLRDRQAERLAVVRFGPFLPAP